MQRKLLATSIALLALSGAVTAQSDVDIPVVPAGLLASAPSPIEPGNTRNRQPESGASTSGEVAPVSQNRFELEPGINQIIPVAIDHLNRIVTPFSNPHVTTTRGAAATTEIRNNVVYVATDRDTPVTMYITQKDSEAQALSLTLVPRGIPPRELFVDIKGNPAALGLLHNRPAEQWETSQPYIETLRGLLRTTAMGELPQGYTFHKIERDTRLPICQQSGLSIDFSAGQRMVGQNLTVSIGTATNTSGQPIEFREASCGDWDVAAVAAWPRNVLSPDEMTEVYVVTRNNHHRPITERRRPSLLGGQ